MTAHVMQVAASPMYIGATKISSLQQAIGRLGFSTITQIVLAVASKTRVFAVPGFETELVLAFRHALATALFAQEIARTRRSTVDVAFLAGLFHDFGQPVLLQALVDLHRELGVTPDPADIMPAVDAAHAGVGAKLVQKWAMPEKVAEAVARHHAPNCPRRHGRRAAARRPAQHLSRGCRSDRQARRRHRDDGEGGRMSEALSEQRFGA